MSKHLYIFSAVVIASIAGLLLWFSTPWGNGTSPDSIQYILTSRELSQLTNPLSLPSHFPILYPAFLSIGYYIAGDGILGARILHCLIFSANVLLISALLYSPRRNTNYTGLLGALLLALAPMSFIIHFMALSEALFNSFILLFFLLFDRFINLENRRWLYLSAIILGLATLTRYSGVAFIGAASLYLLLPGKMRFPQRLFLAIRFGIAAIALPLCWQIAKIFAGHAGSPRTFHFHPIDTDRLMATLYVPYSWLMPETLTPALAISLAAIAGTTITVSLLRGESGVDKQRVQFFLVCIFTYITFLYTSISFFDFYTPIDSRIMSPVFLMLISCLVFSIRSIPSNRPYVPILLSTLFLLPLVAGLPKLSLIVKSTTANGSGYFSRQFRSQEILYNLQSSFLKSPHLPKIYSNSKETLQIYFDIQSESLPPTYYPTNDEVSSTFGDSMGSIVEEVRAGEAVIVYFDHFAWRKYFPPREYFQNELDLPVVFAARDGIIYGKPQQ